MYVNTYLSHPLHSTPWYTSDIPWPRLTRAADSVAVGALAGALAAAGTALVGRDARAVQVVVAPALLVGETHDGEEVQD